MKYTTLFLLSLFFLTGSVFGYGIPKKQNTFMNVGIGFGMNYGILGTKTVIGHNNSGLLIGLGYVPGGVIGYEVGGQISYKWLYLNAGYGVIGTHQVDNNPITAVTGADVLVGAMISLGKKKKAFIDLGVGHTFGAPSLLDSSGNMVDQNTFNAVLGIGLRIGMKPKRKFNCPYRD